MTSRISLGKLMKEEFRHHMVSIFATVLTFLAEILFFYFEIQRLVQNELTGQQNKEVIAAVGEPAFRMMIPAVVLAILLSVEYFKYLHSQKKTDFYMSLPVKRKEKFWLGIIVCGIIFLFPCVVATACECVIGYATGFGTTLFLYNMVWNCLCKILAFLAVFMTMSLAMILTGNLVIAILGFGVFCAYVPLFVKYLFLAFKEVFFDTYVYGAVSAFSETWNYFSPMTLVYKLTMDYRNWTIARHLNYMIAILIFIIVIVVLAKVLYVKRPSEAAGRAMAFPKFNSGIRFCIVIPLALYCGYFLYQASPNQSKVWLYLGAIVGAFLLHGIMESIFQFDLRGMLAKKKQLGVSAVICCAFIMAFQMDITKYDEFVPEAEEVASVIVMPYTNNIQFYDDIYTDEKDGIYGDTIQDVVKLAENLVEQNESFEEEQYDELGYVTIEYQMKNGRKKARQYYYNLEDETCMALMNKIVATEEFKNDYYSLYGTELLMLDNIRWNNGLVIKKMSLTEEEKAEFLEIYLLELTELTLTEMEEENIIAVFSIGYNELGVTASSWSLEEFPVYEDFDRTIGYLSQCGIAINPPFGDCELISLEVFEEYDDEQATIEPGFTVKDVKLLEEVKEEIIPIDLYGKSYVYDVRDSRSAVVEICVNDRLSSYDVYVRDETVQKLESAALYTTE